jgi:RNA polymerase sigma factor (sigma-70 family)
VIQGEQQQAAAAAPMSPEEADRLARMWMPFARKLAARYCASVGDGGARRDIFNEAQAQAMLALAQALATWEPEKGSFSNWLCWKAKGALRKLFDSEVWGRSAKALWSVSLEAACHEEDGKLFLATDEYSREPQTRLMAREEIRHQMALLQAHLGDQEYALLWAIYGEGRTFQEVAQKRGCSYQAIQIRVEAARRRAIEILLADDPEQKSLALARRPGWGQHKGGCCCAPGCQGGRFARGLCPACYSRTKKRVARGEETWEGLFERGEALRPCARGNRYGKEQGEDD